jgi:hypothetical protein
MEEDMHDAFEKAVPNMSDDVRAYIAWRIKNPDTPLPRTRRKRG